MSKRPTRRHCPNLPDDDELSMILLAMQNATQAGAPYVSNRFPLTDSARFLERILRSLVEANRKIDELSEQLGAQAHSAVANARKPYALRVNDAYKHVGLSRSSIYGAIRAGKILSVKCGSRRLVLVASLEAYIRGESDV